MAEPFSIRHNTILIFDGSKKTLAYTYLEDQITAYRWSDGDNKLTNDLIQTEADFEDLCIMFMKMFGLGFERHKIHPGTEGKTIAYIFKQRVH